MKEKISEIVKSCKYYDHGGRFGNETHGSLSFFLTEKIRFKPLTTKYVYTFFQALLLFCIFKLLLVALRGSKIEFYTKLGVQKVVFFASKYTIEIASSFSKILNRSACSKC